MSFIENMINRRTEDVKKEETILNDLQRSDCSCFPGDYYLPADRKNWMANISPEKLTINKIVWPGTHDSATNGIGFLMPKIVKGFAECQTLTIYEQLVRGTRVLDIRVQKDGLVCHGILKSYHVNRVLDDIIRFLSETTSEIMILEIRTESGQNDPPGFDGYLLDKLNKYLVQQSDDVFGKAVTEVLPKRVICVWKPRNSPKPSPGGLLWNSDYLRDDWVDTDLPLTKFNKNMEHLTRLPPVSSRNFFYRTENTLTPQKDNLTGDVRTVTGRIQRYAGLFISQCVSKGHADKLQIFSSDFIEEDFVDACIKLTHARMAGLVK